MIRGTEYQSKLKTYSSIIISKKMENLEKSQIEKINADTGFTGFSVLNGNNQYSQVDDDYSYDNIEIDYVEKLRTQRERMEKLERCYNEKEHMLGKEVERTNQLLVEIQRMASYLPFKEKYEELKHDYNQLLSKYNLQQGELQDAQEELNLVINENSTIINRLKNELKTWKETSNLNTNQLQNTLNDKEEEIRKCKREWREKEDHYGDEIKNLKTIINKLKQELQDGACSYDKQKDIMRSQLKCKEIKMCDLQKMLENARKSNVDLKNDIINLSEDANNRERQYTAVCNKYKHQFTQNKKILSDKDLKIEELEGQLKKTNLSLHNLREDYQNLKIDYRKSCELYENGNKKIKYENQSEIARLQAFVQELKDSIEELMGVKNHLLGENRKLMAILRKKEQMERERKHLLITEFKQIDRIEKVIDRLE